ncbi:MAG TPA: DPP IV N-terminal domain-containing protein [Flavisolibacter sp.]|jgi:dipeptidyl-peptidase-4|nr:DPP IV N-terminal domain-containing protein [Flavisolibacter sp.]
MKKYFFLLPLLLLFFSVSAQNKLLTIEDALVKNRTVLAPENLRQLQFVYGTEDYVYLKKINNQDVWVKGNFRSSSEQTFLSLDNLNQKLRAVGYENLTSMPAIQFNKPTGWIFNANGNRVALDPVSNKIKVLIDKSIINKDIVEESSAGYVAYVDDYNLFVTDGQNAKQITTDGSKDIVYASSVHREEFGIMKGTFWSNNGKTLAFYRMDQSMVTDYPIINWATTPATVDMIKYPMAGDKSHHVTVGVYNAETKSTTYLQTGEPAEQYLTNIAWSPDDKYVFIAVLNREQNHMKLNQYDASTGAFVKTLFEEKDERYVEPLVPMLFVKNNSSQFIWQSNRDGWNHLYLYDMNGKLLKQLTKGNWEVTEVKGFDAKGENLFYTSTKESPITRNLYKLNLKKGITTRITQTSGNHYTQVSTSGNSVIDNFSSTDVARTISLADVKSIKNKIVFNAPNPLADYGLGKMSIFTIRNKNGAPLYCRLYKPTNFDSARKYPVIVYWYGGPHAQLILNSWNGGSGDYWFQYMAERGYVIFTVDPRGSDNRGKEFEQVIHGHAGVPQMEDLMSGVDYLYAQKFVDKNRMGLFGWSYGGFMTIDFMLNHPNVFKVAVAGGPVTDWRYYEIMYGERYMDTPQENPEGYAETDLTKKVQNLKGKLLLIHGLQDPVVVQQHSVRFVRAAIDKNVQVDYMIYPGHEHNVLGKDRGHLYQKVTDYLTEYLKTDSKQF